MIILRTSFLSKKKTVKVLKLLINLHFNPALCTTLSIYDNPPPPTSGKSPARAADVNGIIIPMCEKID